MGSLAKFRMLDEVCNPDAVKPAHAPESFFRFKYHAVMRDPRFLLEPATKAHREFVADYFRHLAALGAPRDIAIDIKYGHVQNFEGFWWPVLERPALLSICENAGIGIIHLYRQNVVEATVSAIVAHKRKIWHSWQTGPGESEVAPCNLPVNEIVRKAKLLERLTGLFKDWTRKNSKVELTYENIVADLGSGGPSEQALMTFLGRKPRKKPFAPRFQKLTPPLREIVENFDELKAACEAAGLGRFVC